MPKENEVKIVIFCDVANTAVVSSIIALVKQQFCEGIHPAYEPGLNVTHQRAKKIKASFTMEKR